MSDTISPAQVEEAVTAVRQQTDRQPTIGLVLGSGLSGLADAIREPDTFAAIRFPIGRPQPLPAMKEGSLLALSRAKLSWSCRAVPTTTKAIP
jgi:hypothetical protein